MPAQAITSWANHRWKNNFEKQGFKGNFDLYLNRSPNRDRLEAYIGKKYNQVHNASISEFMPILFELTKEGETQAVIGLRPGQHKPMFLEQYLDSPIEGLVSKLAKQPVDRCSLIEVGNLAVARKGAGLLLFVVATMAAEKAGFRWMVATVIDEVERLLHRLGFNPQYLHTADPARLEGGSNNWGHYYDRNPRVMVDNLKDMVSALQNNPVLVTILENHKQEITTLSHSLSDYRRLSGRWY